MPLRIQVPFGSNIVLVLPSSREIAVEATADEIVLYDEDQNLYAEDRKYGQWWQTYPATGACV